MRRIAFVLLAVCFAAVVLASASFAQSGPMRGIHLPNRWNYTNGLTSADRWALQQFVPGMVVVLSGNINIPAVEYLRDDLLRNYPSAEIFVRLTSDASSGFTSTCPPQGTTSRGETGSRYYSYNYTTGSVKAMSASDVANEIIRQYDLYRNTYGLTLQRWIPGNEPELEWNYDVLNQWQIAKWQDINAYYTDIALYVNERKGSRNLELYTPAFSQYASVGVGNYNPNGSVSRNFLSDGTTGVDKCRQMVETYHNFTWHNYFWPGCAWQHRVNQFFPQWLQDKLYSQGYPSRITEAGWHPDCNNDRDAWTVSQTGWSGFYEDDLQWFVNNAARAGGVAVWLLGSDADDLQKHVGTWRQWDSPDASLSKARPWFYYYIRRLNGENTRTSPTGYRNLSLNPPAVWVGSEQSESPGWQAFDGLYNSMWNSGGFPTRWIQWPLENWGTYYVSKIRARVAQTPAGWTTHNLKIWTGAQWLIYPKTQYTSNGQFLEWTFDPAIPVNQAHIETTSSPSWVAWYEIETWGQ